MADHITVKCVILDQNKTEDDYCTVSLRVTYKRQHRYKSLGHRVTPKFFDKKSGLVLNGWQNARMYNAYMQNESAKIYKDLMILQETTNFSIKTIEEYLATGSTSGMKVSFDKFVNDYITEQSSLFKKSAGTTRNYIKHLSKFQEFMGRTHIDMNEINTNTLLRYELYLVKKNNAPNTIWDCVTRFFKKFVHLAEKRLKLDFHLDGYEWPKYKESSKDYLTLEELMAIEAKMDTFPAPERIVAHFFLVECYSGIRFSDWGRFSVEKLREDENFKVRAKKNDQMVYLNLTNRPRLRAIIEKIKDEGFKFDFTQEYTNRLLKLIARSCGITKRVSTHTGRHTCATLHLDLGFSKEFVAEILGVSLKTVDYYAKTTRQKLKNEDAMRGGL